MISEDYLFRGTRKYECENCGSIITMRSGENPKDFTCPPKCGKKNWKLLNTEYSFEEKKQELEDFKIIFKEIINVFDFYTDIPEDYKKVLALWIIGTYTHDCFETYPFLFLNARKGSGKTRTERIISHLSKGSKGEVNTGMSESALFRSEQGATLVLDEFESITSKDKQTLREYLQASYKKGATVTRMKRVRKDNKEEYQAEKFHPYRPIVMANINGMDDVLGDRCLTLILEKSENNKIVKIIEDFESNEQIKQILQLLSNKQCSLCNVVMSKNNVKGWNNYIKGIIEVIDTETYTNYITTLSTLTTLTTLKSESLEFYRKVDEMNINGRNLELIFPLLVLVNSILPEQLDEFIRIFKELITVKMGEDVIESKDNSLIEYISKLNNWTDFIELKIILQGFREYIGWSIEDDWLNSKWLGRALTRLKLYSSKRRVAKGTEYCLDVFKAKTLISKTDNKLQVEGGNPVSNQS